MPQVRKNKWATARLSDCAFFMVCVDRTKDAFADSTNEIVSFEEFDTVCSHPANRVFTECGASDCIRFCIDEVNGELPLAPSCFRYCSWLCITHCYNV